MLSSLVKPAGPLVKVECTRPRASDAEFASVYERIEELKSQGPPGGMLPPTSSSLHSSTAAPLPPHEGVQRADGSYESVQRKGFHP
jgi:hypothetical protein